MESSESGSPDGEQPVAGDLQETETKVLRWLLKSADIAKAVDLAFAGNEDEALPLLLQSVKGILAKQAAKSVVAASGAGAEAGIAGAGAVADDAEKAAAVDEASAEAAAPRKRGAESLAGGAAGAPPPAQRQKHGQEWLGQCQEALQAERAAEEARIAAHKADWQRAPEAAAKEPQPLYWKLEVPEVTQVLLKRSILPEHFLITERPHVTLLYIGAQGDDEAAKRSELTPEAFAGMREALEALDGEEFEVRMTRIIIEERVACAVVSLPPILPCSNSIAHITLGTKMGVPPRFANELLEEMSAGRTEGITTIDLPAPRPLTGKVAMHYSTGEE